MKAYSEDIRLRVSAAYDRGMLRKEVSKTFGVSVSTIKRYLKLREQIPFAGAGGGDGRPRGAQDGNGARADRGEGLPAVVLARLLAPDLNPIGEAFSKVKVHLRKAAARTREALVEAMGEALSAVTPRGAKGWFAQCGYGLGGQTP
jgi:Homeodomain-like domain